MSALYYKGKQAPEEVFGTEQDEHWELLTASGYLCHLSDSEMCPPAGMLDRLRRTKRQILSNMKKRKGMLRQFAG